MALAWLMNLGFAGGLAPAVPDVDAFICADPAVLASITGAPALNAVLTATAVVQPSMTGEPDTNTAC